MADEYDVIDFVHDAIKPASTGFVLYKQKSIDGETENHIVVNTLPFNEFDFTNKVYVNVNIFVKLQTNGTVNIPTMKAAKRAVRTALLTIDTTAGQYRDCEIIWSETVDLKDGFDCKNIRVLIQIDK